MTWSIVVGVRSVARRGVGWRGIWFVTPLVLLWTVPLMVFALAFPAANSTEQAAVATRTPATTVVGSVEQDYRSSVSVEVTRKPGRDVLSAATGVVNSVQIEPGDTLRTGTQLLTVGGLPVFAVVDRAPLYREIGKGDSGGDVATMCEVLHAQGLWGPGSCTTVTKSVKSAIKAFEKRFGLVTSGRFRPDYTVYVPAGSGEVGSVNVARGDQVDSATVVAQMSSRVTKVTIRAADEGATLDDLTDAPVTLSVGTKDIELDSTSVPRARRSKVARTLAKQASAGTIQGSEGDTPGETSYQGLMLRLSDPATVATAPSSAIYPSASGTMCVFTTDGTTGGAVDPLVVEQAEELTSPLGSVGVDASLIGTTVVTDVSTLSWDTVNQCG